MLIIACMYDIIIPPSDSVFERKAQAVKGRNIDSIVDCFINSLSSITAHIVKGNIEPAPYTKKYRAVS